MMQSRTNADDQAAGDPHNVWSNRIFDVVTVLVQVTTIVVAVVMLFARSKEARKHIKKAASHVSNFVGSRLASAGSTMESADGIDTDPEPDAGPTEPDLADAEAGAKRPPEPRP